MLARIVNRLPVSFRTRYRYSWYRLRFGARSIIGAAVRSLRRPPLPDIDKEGLKLHLGCGDVDLPGFVNIDVSPAPHVHHVRRVERLPLFADGTVDLIYASHVLEHFPHESVVGVLSEWRRVLKPGGVLRLSVPDFDKLLAIYEACDRDLGPIIGMLYGAQADPFDFHGTAFTARSLEGALRRAGFSAVRAWVPGVDTPAPGDWSTARIEAAGRSFELSLNLEGVK